MVEEGEESFCAYMPDLFGCVAGSGTTEKVIQCIKEVLEFHIDGLHADNEPVPRPSSWAEFIEAVALLNS